MRRLYGIAAVIALLSGCYADAEYVQPGGAQVYAEGPEAGVNVSVAPPPLQYEAPLSCGYGTSFVPGYWDWTGSWTWSPGLCQPVRAGFTYIAPSYVGGVYVRGYWGRPGVVYAPGYRAGYRAGYVAPGYRAGYVAPGYRAGYVAPGYRAGYVAPGYRAGYVAPGYRAGVVVAPRAGYVAPRAGVVVAPRGRVVVPAPRANVRINVR